MENMDGTSYKTYTIRHTYQNKSVTNLRNIRALNPPPKINIPLMSSTDATIHPVQDLINALQNPAPARPLFILGNAHKEALISLADIYINPPPSSSTSERSRQGSIPIKI